MDSTNTTTLDQPAHVTPQRPQFLTVLCILTWIACGLMFITSVWGILFKPSAEEQYEQVEKIREVSPEAAENMEALIEKQNSSTQLLNTALSLVGLGLSAFGAYLMWQMRRRGFYMYLGGELLPYLGFLFAGDEAMAAMNFFGPNGAMLIIGGMVVLDVIFIAMYAMNLKHLARS